MKKAVLTLSLLLSLVLVKAQKSTLDKAWQSFFENNNKRALEFFSEATKDPNTAEEAWIAKAMIASADGDVDDAMTNFQEFYKIAKNPYPYIDVLWGSTAVASRGKKSKERIKFLNQLLKDPKLPEYLRVRTANAIGHHYAAIGDFKKANAEYAKMGTVDRWMAVGEFENISASGFDKNYDPIAKPGIDNTFTNKYGAPVKWFPIKQLRNDRWVDFEYYFYAGNSVIFAQTYANCPDERDVQLRIGVSGSVKMWLNDNLILSEEEERNNDFDSYILQTRLHKGYNRILIQIGESEADNSNFMLRITDGNGKAYTDINYNHLEDQEYNKASSTVTLLPIPPEEFFEAAVKENDNFLNRLLLANVYLNQDKKYEARRALVKLEEMAPQCSYVQAKLLDVYLREGNRTAIVKVLEWLKANDKDNPATLGILFSEAINDEDYQEADSVLDILEDKMGSKDAEILNKKMTLYSKQDKTEELIRIIEQAYKLYPEEETFVEYKAAVEKAKKNNAGAIAVYKKYLKKNYDVQGMKTLAGLYFKAGNVPAGLDLYEKIVKNEPVSVRSYSDLAEIRMQLSQYDAALDMIGKAIEIAPNIGWYYSVRGKCYEEMGKKSMAQAEYQKCISLAPTEYETRRRLRNLQGEDENIFSKFETRDVYKIFKEGGKAEDYPDDNSVILVNDVQRVVYADGASEERHVLVVKVLNAAGIDNWKEYTIPVYGTQNATVEKVEVLKANGSKFEAERSGADIVFTNLEAGDGIHVSYRVENYNRGKLAPHFTDKHYFQVFYPVKYSTYSLLIHPDVKFSYKFANGGFEPDKSKNGEYDQYIWKKENVKALKSEQYMAELVDFSEVLYLSTLPDWTYVSNWYSDLAKTKQKADYEVKETAAEIFKDKPTNLSDVEKAKIIHDYIVKNIRYSMVSFRQSGHIPQKASKVINTRVGDCKDVSTLFVSLCREVGIDSVGLVLVSTRENGKNDMYLPSVEFNHCISSLTADGQNYFVELTSDKNGFGTYPNTLKNAFALKIYSENDKIKSEPFYVAAPTKTPDNVIRTSTITFTPAKEMIVDVATIKTGLWASSMRYNYADISESERKKSLLEVLSSENTSVKLNSFKLSRLDEISDTVNYTFNYTIGNAITQITGLNIFTLPWAEKQNNINLFSAEERDFPIEFWRFIATDFEVETMTIKLPEGKTLAEIPKDVKLSCKAAEYKLSFKVKGNIVEARREMTVKTDMISVADYKEIRTFFEKVVAEDTKQLAFK